MRISPAFLLLTLLFGLPAATYADPKPEGPSVILMIGDGMGMSQVTLGKRGAEELGRSYNFDRFRTIGLASTRSASHIVTDSAAAATALSTGVKTNNKMIGVDPQGRRLETLLEIAHRSGYATGLVTTTRITHATPAGFATHVDHRNKEDLIAAQLVEKAEEGYPQVMIGGGKRRFSEDQLARLRAAGFDVALDPSQLDDASGTKLAAFLTSSHLPYAIDRPAGFPSLKELTAKAVETLSKNGPYFLMVEGGRIDHAGHSHDAPALIREQLDFDEAVGWVLDLVGRDSGVLVVVTADHATGGLAITENTDVEGLLKASSSVEMMLRRSLAAAKKAAEQRRGLTQILENDSAADDPGTMLRRLLPFVSRELSEHHGVSLDRETVGLLRKYPGDKYWAPLALGHSLSKRYSIGWYDPIFQQESMTNTHGHDGADVGVFACGPGAQRFAGMFENTEIPKRLAKLMGIPTPGRVAPEPFRAVAHLGALGE